MTCLIRMVFALALSAPLAFPVFAAVEMVNSGLFGDGVTAYLWQFESRREVWNRFWSDWHQALPALYALHAAAMLPVLAVSQLRQAGTPWYVFSLAGAAVGAGTSLLVHGTPGLSASAGPVVAGAVSCGVFGLIVHCLRERRAVVYG